MSQIGTRVTLTDIAARMTKAHPERRFTPGQVSEYQKAEVMSYPLEVIWAYAKATGVDPGWLAFGEASAAPPPSGIPDAPLTPVPRPRRPKKRG